MRSVQGNTKIAVSINSGEMQATTPTGPKVMARAVSPLHSRPPKSPRLPVHRSSTYTLETEDTGDNFCSQNTESILRIPSCTGEGLGYEATIQGMILNAWSNLGISEDESDQVKEMTNKAIEAAHKITNHTRNNDSDAISTMSDETSRQAAARADKYGATNELHRIAKVGDWNTLRARLTVASDHDTTVTLAGQVDDQGRTPLILACRHGPSFPADVARLLLVANNRSAGIYVLQRRGKVYPLHVAASMGCTLEVLSILHGAFPRAVHSADGDGNMPLHLVVKHGKFRSVQSQSSNLSGGSAMGAHNAEQLDTSSYSDKSWHVGTVITAISTDTPGTGSADVGGMTASSSYLLPSSPMPTSINDSGIKYDDRDIEDMCTVADSVMGGTFFSVGLSNGGGGMNHSFFAGNNNYSHHRDTLLIHVCDFLIGAHIGALCHQNSRGETPLLLALCRRVPADVVSLFLAKGGSESVMIADNFGAHPLHFCDRASSVSLVREMVNLYPKAVACATKLGETPLWSAMSDSCPLIVLRLCLEECPRPKMTTHYENIKQCNVIKFGWEQLTVPRIVAAEDQDDEDERIKTCEERIVTASGVAEIRGTHLGFWWDKTELLLRAAYHDTIIVDEKTNLFNGRIWRPIHAVAGTDCPSSMVEFVIHLFPDQAGNIDELGNTPLHVGASRPETACAETMKHLFQSCPASGLVQNQDGCTPLHLACLHGAPLDVLKLLLDSCPDAALVQNNAGQSPLFVSIAIGSSLDVLQEILKIRPSSVHIRDEMGTSTITLAWTMLLSGLQTLLSSQGNVEETGLGRANILSMSIASVSDSLSTTVKMWMAKIHLLLRTSFHGTSAKSLPHGRHFREVHAAAAAGICPPDVLAFALQLMPGEESVKNENGNLPLHLVASAPPHLHLTSPQMGDGAVSIDLLLSLNDADAAKRFDRRGRLPLHLALASSKTWHRVGVKSLVESFPESVQMRDPETGLMPFMLAGASSNKTLQKEEDQKIAPDLESHSEIAEASSLDTIYNLLRGTPRLIRQGMYQKNKNDNDNDNEDNNSSSGQNTHLNGAEMQYLWRVRSSLLNETMSLKQKVEELEAEILRRMTKAEIKTIEDKKVQDAATKREKECDTRADRFGIYANEMAQTISKIAERINKFEGHR